jgi:hypothetical protein
LRDCGDGSMAVRMNQRPNQPGVISCATPRGRPGRPFSMAAT